MSTKKKNLNKTSIFLSLILLFSTFFSVFSANYAPKTAHAAVTFNHPGILHTQADLDRMKTKVAQGLTPWTDEFNRLKDNGLASSTYTPTFLATVCRNDSVCGTTGDQALQDSATAAYLNALEWYITGNTAYANKAIQILDGWSSMLVEIKGADAILAASIYGYKLLNAAEILRYTNAGWTTTGINNFTTMMTNIFYPITQGYGWVGTWANGNWDAACILFNMSYGVWKDDDVIYNDAVNFFKSGSGNGTINHYIQTDDGQTQESGRDQGHTQAAVGFLSLAAEIGYNQSSVVANGGDMYSYPNNSYILLKGLEYTAKYNLGYNVPWTTLPDVNNEVRYQFNVSNANRGEFAPMWEQVYNFYKNRIGLPDSSLPFTKKIVNAVKLEDNNYDLPSYGSLLYAQDQRTAPLLLRIGLITRNLTNKFISADSSGANPLIANQNRYLADGSFNAGSEETFELNYLGNKIYTLKSLANGLYVTAGNAGVNPLQATSSTVGTEQKFELTYNQNNLITMKALANSKYVTLNPTTFLLEADSTSVTADDGRYIVMHLQSPVSDTTAPSTPTNLAATTSGSEIKLTWTVSSDNDAVIGYKIYRNGAEVGTSYSLYAGSYTDTGLAQDTLYNYTIKAFDTAGNLSAGSNLASAKTFYQYSAAADAHVRGGASANTNYGTTSTLIEKLSSSDFTYEDFVKFDLSAYPASSVASAKVRLFVKSVGTNIGTTEASYVSSDSWTESGITWNTKPSSGAVLATWTKPAAGTFVEFDVTSQLNTELANSSDKKLSLRIRQLTSGDSIEYNAKEATANGPVLIVTPVQQITSGATYKLVARHSVKLAGVSGNSTADGASIVQQTDTGNNAQKWTVTDLGTGYYKILNVNSGKSLDVSGASTVDGANIIQWTYGGGNNQQWQIVDVGNGASKLVARHSGKAIDVSGNSTADGATILQWTYNGNSNQQWFLIKQ